ncbi:MAG: AAA family ATPase [Fimbriimonadaceae bacterium]|nr:AAA family ATPase [Fimbriimonadaceae bacterium]QYK57614.1 MAG: AAA family ATPase [Fimbriimonadaceae bacterium]
MDPSSGTALSLLERIADLAPADNAKLQNYLAALKQEIEASELSAAEREKALAAYEEAYEKLTSPANRIGVFLSSLEDGLALVALGDTEYVAKVDPTLDAGRLMTGSRIRLNEAYAVVGVMEPSSLGPIVKVSEVLSDGRLRVGADPQGQAGKLVERADALRDLPFKAGDEVALDATGRVAVERFERNQARDYFVEDVPFTPWEAVGGQEEAIRLIRETIEQPLLYPEIYQAYDKKPIKGVLLYGPPGCGKTLIGKAVASNLAKEYSERVGREAKECFMHISGPKILNMWLGETERMVREIFDAARERAKEGQLVVVFIDEAESVLRTRSSGRWLNISNTVVPQFCAEMDGMVELENVVLILTSNRPDYIDPAILRPERIDRKIKIRRPDYDASREILSIYLHDRLPVDSALVKEHVEPECARRALVEAALAHLWRDIEDTEFMRVTLRNGTSQTLHWRDFVSGALLKSVVDRAKDTAIRRAIAAKSKAGGLTVADLRGAIESEFQENEIFPKSDSVEDWLKLLDLEPEQVVAVKPVRSSRGDEFARRSVV